MATKTCAICGKASGMYPLCKDCFKLRDDGKIVQCPDCKTWHYTNQPCNCEDEEIDIERQPLPDKKCIICGENAPQGPFCRDCYYEMLDVKDSFDKNQASYQLRDWYFHLKSNIYRMNNFEYVQSNCIRLMALSVLSKELHNDVSLTNRVVTDIVEIIDKKQAKENKTNTEYSSIKDEHEEEIKRTLDGHRVESDAEAAIDDILYELRIVHCYGKKVPTDIDEKPIITDWFIPVLNITKGIYIEYWGMNTKEYLENKDRKIKSYKKHNFPLISIEKDEYKDKQGLTDRLQREINQLAKEYYKIEDFFN